MLWKFKNRMILRVVSSTITLKKKSNSINPLIKIISFIDILVSNMSHIKKGSCSGGHLRWC